MNKLEQAVQFQFPSFIREEYPALIKFMQVYYRYVDTLSTIDTASPAALETTTQYIQNYKNEFLRDFGEPEFLSLKEFIYNNKKLFELKGTDDAFKFYFKAYFNEDIEVKHPTMLIASGGGIKGFYFIQVRKTPTSTSIAEVNDILSVYIGTTEYRIQVEKVEHLESNLDRIYFNLPKGYDAPIGSVVKIEAKPSYEGQIEASPFRMNVLTGGKFWQIGKVFYAGPYLCRVKALNGSAISKIEILHYGHPAADGDVYTVRPFPRAPIGAIFDYTKVGNVHTMKIRDSSMYMDDTITAFGDIASSSNTLYVNIGYVDADYTIGASLLYMETIHPSGLTGLTEDYTFDDWMASRSQIQIVFDNYSREKLEFISDESMLSNQATCLQDNKFYQQFSYAIESKTDYRKYSNAIAKLHPAGLHFIGNRVNESNITLNVSAE